MQLQEAAVYVQNLFLYYSITDLGHGVPDNTFQVEKLEQASLNTTKNVYSEINETDLIVHIGDLSYAVGYSAQVKHVMLQNTRE